MMLVLTLASFTYPVKKMADTPRTAKTHLSNYTVYFINYGGAGSNMSIDISGDPVVTDDNTSSLGSYPEGSYGFAISKLTPDNTLRYVQVEDPNYQGPPPYQYFWSSGDFYGTINVNDIWDNISVGYVQ